MAEQQHYFLGIDGGGTGCRTRVADASGNVLGSGHAGPASLRLGAEAAWAEMMNAADAALAHAGLLKTKHLVRCGAGVAGVGRLGALEEVQRIPHPFASFAIANDAVTACLGAHAGGDGGIVIAGTGAIGFARMGGQEIRVAGWGFPVSDEGSGAWLGLEALRLALKSYDGRVAKTPLLAEIMARYGNDPFAVVAWMDRASATDYATLAPMIVANADAGDTVARDLLQRAAKEIGGLATALLDRGVGRVALLGGLAPVLEPMMDDAIRKRLSKPEGDALDGALLLAGLGG